MNELMSDPGDVTTLAVEVGCAEIFWAIVKFWITDNQRVCDRSN